MGHFPADDDALSGTGLIQKAQHFLNTRCTNSKGSTFSGARAVLLGCSVKLSMILTFNAAVASEHMGKGIIICVKSEMLR